MLVYVIYKFSIYLFQCPFNPPMIDEADTRSISQVRLSFTVVPSSMPCSDSSQHNSQTVDEDDEEEEEENIFSSRGSVLTPTSTAAIRRLHSARTSDIDLRNRLPSRLHLDEHSSLLAFTDGVPQTYTSEPNTSRPQFSRQQSISGSVRNLRNHSRASSWGIRLANAVGIGRRPSVPGLAESKASLFTDERVWYDQFTSTDWVHDSIADAFRVRDLRLRKDVRGRLYAWFDGAQGWILVAIIGCITACIAYFVNVTEASIFDLKEGHCEGGWYFSKRKCCYGGETCPAWRTWGDQLPVKGVDKNWVDFMAFVFFAVFFSVGACLLTLMTKTVIPSAFSLSTLDENLGADSQKPFIASDDGGNEEDVSHSRDSDSMVYYPAAGSGVAEVKVILSGFVVHGYLGVKTLIIKSLALILSVASGLSLGKEGPYVHIATCVGNIACRLFSKYHHNDGKRREVLSASAASGVGVAFGAPIGGVLFSLEEVRYVTISRVQLGFSSEVSLATIFLRKRCSEHSFAAS